MTRIAQYAPARLSLLLTSLVLALVLPLLFAGPAHAEQQAVLKLGAPAPDFAFTTLDGSAHQLSQFRGKPVMPWFFASWCPTCITSTKEISVRFDTLTANGLQIIQLRLYDNLGYRGPSAGEFAETYAGTSGDSPNWLWGEASLEVSVTYDPRGYPDLYFLIDREGILRAANGAPNAILNDILDFAGNS